jgi:hypothetical protein
MTFHGLKIGEMFEVRYEPAHGLSVKLSDKTALDLANGQVCQVHFNKIVESPGSLNFDKSLFLTWHKGKPVLCRKTSGGYIIFSLLITKSELLRDAIALQGIPFAEHPEGNIIFDRIKTRLNECQSLVSALAMLRDA